MKQMNKKMPAGAPMGGPVGKRKVDFKQLGRVVKMLFGYYH